MLGLVVVLYVGPKHQEEKLTKILASSDREKVDFVIDDVDNPDFYGKLVHNEPIDMLVVGDSLSTSDEDNAWYTLLSNSLSDEYETEVNINVQTTDAGLYNNWMDYLSEKQQAYDLIFFLQGDNDNRTEEEYKHLYEAFLSELTSQHPKAEIMTVTESGMDEQQSSVIQELAAYYHVVLIDNVEVAGDEDDAGLRDKMFNYIRTYVYGNKKVSYPEKEFLYEGTETYKNMNVLSLVDLEDPISLSFSGSLVGISYKTGPDHGFFDVYVDGAYVDSYDTYGEEEMVQHIIVSDTLDSGEHAITIQPSILTNEDSSGDELEFIGLITS